MKFALSIILAALAIVPALADGGTNTSARVRHRAREAMKAQAAKLAAMSPEEREAYRLKVMENRRINRAAERSEQTKSITAKFAAAKAACPDCYRVVVTNGVYVGMTKSQYDAYNAAKAEEGRRDRKIIQARKIRNRMPVKNFRSHSRKHMKKRKPVNG